MRNSFISTLENLAEKNKDIFLLSPDMGFSVFEAFRERFPDRFINTGIAEANTIGIAAGLALTGKIVFVYSIVPFVTMRCLEQIRMDICYQDMDVKLVGVGGGLRYGPAGTSHHSIEDVSIMRSLPNMKIICPGDPCEAGLAIEEALRCKGPVYVRIAKTKDPIVHQSKDIKFKMGKGIILREGKDIAVIATGSMLYNAKVLTDILAAKGVDTCLVSMHTIKPIDKELILKLAKKTRAVFTIEEHSLIGGLGSSVAEIIAESSFKGVYFERIALPDLYINYVGSQEYLHRIYKLLPHQMSERILRKVKNERQEKNKKRGPR